MKPSGADDSKISPDELGRRRAGARRTALILGGIVLVIFVTFLATGILGR